MIRIDYRQIKSTVYIVLSLPIVMFLFGWVRLLLALPLAMLMIISLVVIIREYLAEEKTLIENDAVEVSRSGLAFIIFAAMLWCFLAGQGGFFYQTSDYHFRNAVFRDLINLPWPVQYEHSNTTLVYYLTYWLVPAGIAKLTMLALGADAAWLAGNIFLYVWTSLLVSLTFLMLMIKVRAFSFWRILITVLVFILFSGLDIIGFLAVQQGQSNDLEWWAYFYQYSANATQLSYVFNQSVPAWLLMLLLIQEKSVVNFAFIGFLAFSYSPFPFIGLLPFLVVYAIVFAVKERRAHRFSDFLKQLFSFQNIVALLFVFPVFALFFASNGSVSEGTANRLIQIYIGQDFLPLYQSILLYVLFCLLEFGIYTAVLWQGNHKNLLFWICVLSLCLIGMFQMAGRVDFAMRASIPALVVLAVMVIEYINQNIMQPKHSGEGPKALLRKKLPAMVLIVALILGSFTPVFDYIRAFTAVAHEKKLSVVADDIKTFSDCGADDPSTLYTNFMSTGYHYSAFAKHLGKKDN